MMKQMTPQAKAEKEADKLRKLRAFVQQNAELQRLNALSNPEEVEKALKDAQAPRVSKTSGKSGK